MVFKQKKKGKKKSPDNKSQDEDSIVNLITKK